MAGLFTPIYGLTRAQVDNTRAKMHTLFAHVKLAYSICYVTCFCILSYANSPSRNLDITLGPGKQAGGTFCSPVNDWIWFMRSTSSGRELVEMRSAAI